MIRKTRSPKMAALVGPAWGIFTVKVCLMSSIKCLTFQINKVWKYQEDWWGWYTSIESDIAKSELFWQLLKLHQTPPKVKILEEILILIIWSWQMSGLVLLAYYNLSFWLAAVANSCLPTPGISWPSRTSESQGKEFGPIAILITWSMKMTQMKRQKQTDVLLINSLSDPSFTET